ncbi:hypothetical protein [Rhizobium rhizogenes]|uniref:hypothetical protein n=1 Tax=Rhizobium rhizogenes TaxID=359 RepID=UPI0004D39F6E|nr:hypothetical protein [Rhizobium rhizogenes]KEA07168.1 hypothetical protein CN09_09540 [Rhizobium rhizogenes]NTI80389.1 hypothetical protein [Rhizobium rhizogenes]NTJ22575.1 hypothetical protein [Rhizobium rhizogenes]QUE81281.1 hypothetical protein EML492_05595 [Rhizobium rhizogenes]TQO80619.1 hypothetical protein FFE80_05825 [Rhizobium rhizogenes]
MKRPTPATLQVQCDAFNSRYPVGQKVSVRKDDGAGSITFTRSKAEVLSGHSAVIWLEGISGCYLLDRVTAIMEAAHG